VELASQRLQVHPADDVPDRLGAHAGAEEPALAGLVELLVEAAQLELADRQHRLDGLELVTELPELVLQALGLLLELVLLGTERLVHARAEVGDLLVDRGLLVALALLDLLVEALRLGAGDGPELGRGGLARLLAGGDDDLAGRREDDRLLGLAGLELGEPSLDRLGGRRDLLDPAGALGLELRLGLLEGDRQLLALAIDVLLQLRLEVGEALAGLAAAATRETVQVRCRDQSSNPARLIPPRSGRR
jgi:hypothetical protein